MLNADGYSLLMAVFCIVIIKQSIDVIGRKNIESFCWKLYCQIAARLGHSKLSHLASLTRQLNQVNKERKSISAQDEYAKWTKLNRQFDKLSGEIGKMDQELSQDMTTVNKYLGYIITAVTTAPIWFCRVWYRKAVLFYFPPGVFPYVMERLFAIPFVVIGGVGLTVWMFSVNSVVSSVIFMVKFAFEEEPERGEKQEKGEKVEKGKKQEMKN